MPKPRFRKRRVNTVAEYVATTMEFAANWGNADGFVFRPWYRGVPDHSLPLLPGIYRPRFASLGEDDFRQDFERRAYPYLVGTARQPRDQWDWYFIMQHHGLPTRLLDWTESSLVALYFAIRDANTSTNAAVWMLDPWWMNQAIAGLANCVLSPTDIRAEDYLSVPNAVNAPPIPAAPIAMEAPHASTRIAAQKGAFTLHGADRRPLEEHAAFGSKSARVVKIELDTARLRDFHIHLALAGITETSVFPDLPSLARDLISFWTGWN